MEEQLELDFGFPFPLVGITGEAWSGKDTAAGVLESAGYTRLAFAEPLYGMLDVLLTQYMGQSSRYMSREWKDKPIPFFASNAPTFRRMIQTLGTEWGRRLIHPDLWLDIMAKRIENTSGYSPVVVSDVRFDNEAKLIKDTGGYIVKIERANSPKAEAHISEAGVSDKYIDRIVNNDRDLESFKSEIRSIFAISTLPEGKAIC